jgi:Asp-tRNA(Asn)/Glu-tRNA(Gln) amidotransferase A subunit family amidase
LTPSDSERRITRVRLPPPDPLRPSFSRPPARPHLQDPLGAFCKDIDAYAPGLKSGPLSGLTFPAKDIFDVAGLVFSAAIREPKLVEANTNQL